MSGAGEGAGGSGRAPRLPRWTRQEILVLIEGKRVVEGRGRGRGRGGGGGAAAEPTKWAAVAEYCRRHGLERGPVQCRKRWSNLAGDYKKIREWERSLSSPAGGGKEVSFWAMRNDARRERRLPGFFDREVYDILEGRGGNAAAAAKEEKAAVFDSGRAAAAAAGDDGLFSSSEEEDEDEEATPPAPSPAPAAVPPPATEKKTDPPRQEASEQVGTSRAKQPEQIVEDLPAQGAHKRQRSDDASGEAPDLQGQLIEILDQSSRMVAAQLEAQNMNCQLDREQRKDQVSSLLGVLSKVADALYRIADKM
ncbi:trihelix transcription factor ASR3 [Oryza brachyantha]|uniref:trihelix transcription factor ASR3 n=1 Tax=Oryza brachyantha TaxID=4533 RepID=UPI001AD9EAB5|nr:trihelix transcription factor ASR3 [Oryza brachyantha]